MKFRNLFSLAAVLSLCGLTSCGDSSSQTSDSSSTPVSSTTPSSSSSSSTSIGVPEEYDISQITTANKEYTVRGEVAAMNSSAFLITDGDDSIYVYGRELVKKVEIGQYVEITGTTESYSNALQFSYKTEPTIKVLDEESPVTLPTPTPLTSEIANSWKSTKSFTTKDVKLYTWTATAGTVTSGDKTFDTLNIEGSDFDIEPVYLPNTFKITTGTTYNVEAYLTGATKTYAAIVLTSLTAA